MIAATTHRRAFTLVELCLGMLTTALVAAGVAAIASATALQWNDGQDRQLIDVTLQQYRHVVGPIIRSSRALGGVVTRDRTGVFLWQADNWNGNADGQAQFAEMALIEFDEETQSLLYYQADTARLTPASPNAATILTDAQTADADIVALFKQQAWIKPPRSLLGPGRSVNASATIARVNTAAFVVSKAANLQKLQMHLTVSRGTLTRDVSDVFGVRAPAVESP